MEIKFAKRLQGVQGQNIFDRIDDQVAKLKSQGINIIDFGVGDPAKAYDPLHAAIDELTPSANRQKNSGYPTTSGQQTYRQACANYLKRRFSINLDIDKEICVTIASKEAVFLFPMTLVDPDNYVIIPTPGYPTFSSGVNYIGGKPYYVPLLEENDFLIDFASIPSEIVQKTKFIWINYPNAPTGALAPLEWLEKLTAWAEKNNIVIASDEGCYIDLYSNQKPHSILEVTKKGVIAFYSLSKRSNMTNYRIGFVAGDERLVENFKTIRNRVHDGAPNFIQDAAIKAWNDDMLPARMREIYNQGRAIITSAFNEIGLPQTKSTATFFIWQKARQGMTGEQLAAKLLELGIVTIPGSALTNLTTDGINAGNDYIRMALIPSLDQIKEAANRIKKDLKL